MSTPPFLAPPAGTSTAPLDTLRGSFAAWVLDPAGTRPRGTALLVPGFTGSKEDFVAVLAPLAAAGWRVVTYDQRGQHETPGTPQAPESAYGLPQLALDLLAVVEAVRQGPVHLVGHSFGGLVAREAVLVSPEAVTSLTLLSSGPGGVGGPTAQLADAFATALETLPIEQVWDAKVAYDAANGLHPPEDPDVAAFLRSRFISNDPLGLAAFARTLVSAPDRTAELAALPTPVLVAYGERDDAWPPEVQSTMADRLGARHQVVADSGHSPAAEAPDATAALLTQFWVSTLSAA